MLPSPWRTQLLPLGSMGWHRQIALEEVLKEWVFVQTSQVNFLLKTLVNGEIDWEKITFLYSWDPLYINFVCLDHHPKRYRDMIRELCHVILADFKAGFVFSLGQNVFGQPDLWRYTFPVALIALISSRRQIKPNEFPGYYHA